jgi:cyclophilin family peptidyl-prolyl cis-trans isomerase
MQRNKQHIRQRTLQTSRRKFFSLLASSVAALSLSSAFSIAHAVDVPHVLLKTNMGDIVLELNADKAPKTVKNFLSYVNTGHYNGTIFHRVIDGFMIQGGGYDKNMREKSAPNKVVNEANNGLKNTEYSVAMARTSDPQSAAAQFFINVKDNQFLNYPGQDGYGYAVFGKVIKGTEVVDKIKKVQTGGQDVPVQQVIIESATITK